LNGAVLFDERFVANPLVSVVLSFNAERYGKAGKQKPGDLVVVVAVKPDAMAFMA